jgi:hypothetical protein
VTAITTRTTLTNIAGQIKAEHEKACMAARATVEHAIRVGELLIEAKQLVQHGYWGDWLHMHCDLSERSAQSYMRLAHHRANPQLSADLTIDDALKALAKPKPVEIEDADALVTDSADYLQPSVAGQARIGLLEVAEFTETFGVIEDEHHPGFYRIALMETYGDLETDGGGGSVTQPKGGRPVRGDFVRELFERWMRRPNLFDQITWWDHPADHWPFPAPLERWPNLRGD